MEKELRYKWLLKGEKNVFFRRKEEKRKENS